MTENDRIDFSPLEAPSLDALMAGIEARCAPLLAQRRSRRTTIQIVAWRRPALAAALVIGAVSMIVLLRSAGNTGRTRLANPAMATQPLLQTQTQVAVMLGVPRPLVKHITILAPPTLADLVQETVR